MYRIFAVFTAAAVALALTGCHGGGTLNLDSLGGGSGGSTTSKAEAVTYKICRDANSTDAELQKQTLIAFFNAREGDTIEFCQGQYNFDTSLIMTGRRGITIKGAGMNNTVLSFKHSTGQDGININQTDGVVLEGLTIYDAPGNGLRLFRSKYISIRDVKVGWSVADPNSPQWFKSNYNPDPQSWAHNGAYAFYPVVSRHILIEDSVSVGSSDAGVYVGQSSDILVRNTEAYHNVAGFEFENTYRAEFINNKAHDNVGGFLVFDLPGRVQFGEKNIVHENESWNNNIPSFAPHGAIVAAVPSGTGMLVFASDQLELYDNNIHDNDTLGLAIVNYGLADASESATNYDFFPEGIHIYNNTFANNGGSPELPDLSRSSCNGITALDSVLEPVLDPLVPQVLQLLHSLPGLNDDPTCLTDNTTLLPLVIVAKNLGKSAQIIWDGARDKPNSCTKVPVDADGIALNAPNPNDTSRPEARTDERGRPNLYQYDPIPECKWNAWKFNDKGQLKLPQNGICIENNHFIKTKTPLVDNYANLHLATADLTNPDNLQLATHDVPHDCPTVSADLLPQFQPNLGTFTATPQPGAHPSQSELAAVCGKGSAGNINRDALARYNCPTLDDYGLFKNPEDPTTGPSGQGFLYDLNTILFTDYASKYRFLFIPPGQQAIYQDHDTCTTLNIYSCYTQTLKFPVGTAIAKTFAFKNGDDLNVVETRLLIKRQKDDGSVYWEGLPYQWVDDGNGHRHAELRIEGATVSTTYDYDDPDPEVVYQTGPDKGKVKHYKGTVDAYGIPNAGACILCHNGDDLEAGAPPIGPKVRNLNKDHDYPGLGRMNQLAYMKMKGLLASLPDDPSKLERLPRFDVPGDSGEQPGSPADINARARAFLEVNCMHCHNPAGDAQNSGLRLDSFQHPLRHDHGICKPPVAAGRAADFGDYDIQPGDAARSILPNRVASTDPAKRMPPVARTVMQAEAVDLLNTWVNQVVAQFADPKDNTCGGNSGLPSILPKSAPRLPGTKAAHAPWG